jgi:hypothetical protein
MTSPAYSYLSLVGPWPLKITTTDVINPGDRLFWDAATKTHRPLTDPTKGDLFSGVALGQWPVSSNLDNGIVVPDPSVPASLGALHNWFGTVGETLTMGDPVYVGADAQTVVKAAPGGTTVADIVGYFWPDDGNDLTVVAGQKVQIRAIINWPSPSFAS